MSRICPLFSGSTGNSTYISTPNGGILIDAGASFKGLVCELERAGGKIEDICAIAVTHEHSDHIKGLKTFLSKVKVPLIASHKTMETLSALNCLPAGTQTLCTETEVSVGDILIRRFPTSHDCEGSSGYSINTPDGKKISVCTDLGVVTQEVATALCGSNVVLLESNHDVQMLKRGPYPPHLKLRIMSDSGHLSNNDCAAQLPFLLENGTTRIILGHISRHNNLPMLAISSAKAALMDIGAEKDKDYLLYAASPTGNEVVLI